ncbi:alpha/beta hydrolase [Wenzhouxiangella sp. 15181]|nr:alpha/beta hydrolase [Wenzhouxiangella sp. 15181]RFP69543.1 alpha/beta hydrolase [Wenzhouxiangella sp. 15190]
MPNFQGRELAATPAQIGLPYRDVTLSTEDGETLHGWWLPHDQPRATLLFFHGNAGNISHRLDSLKIFHELGLQVFIIDYRGYGQSSGKPSEAGVYRDAQAAWNWLTETEGVRPENIILFGRSLGGAVASRLAGRVEAAGLIVESTFTSAPDIGAELYWWLPVRLLSRLEFNAADHIRRTDLPILIVHSLEDEIIPVEHGRRLYKIAGDRGTMLEIQGGHNTGFLESGERYRKGLQQFVEAATD